MDLGLETTARGGVTVIAVSGEIDLGSAPRVREVAVGRLMDGDAALVLDLGGVEFIDSTGLGTLVAVLKRARSLGAELLVVLERPGVRKVFELTGLDAAFDLFDDLDTAVAAARARGGGGGP